MRYRDQPPARSLILSSCPDFGDETLRITGSNRGEPYRETLHLTFERGTGPGQDLSAYEHLATAELEPDEERALRAMLNARAAARFRHGVTSPDARRAFMVTDFDRLDAGLVSEAEAFAKLEQISTRFPGNVIHLLGTLATANGGDVRLIEAWADVGEETPRNTRLIVEGVHAAGHDECAMAWLDRADERWYYAPQGGRIEWTVKRWQHIPAASERT